MSSLLGKTVYVDANAFIYAYEASETYPNLRAKFLVPLSLGQFAAVTSWITLAELLHKPLSLGDPDLIDGYRRLIRPSSVLRVYPVDEAVVALAANIRSETLLKLPDAIHIATGRLAQCDVFLTSDAQWAKVGVPVVDPTQL